MTPEPRINRLKTPAIAPEPATHARDGRDLGAGGHEAARRRLSPANQPGYGAQAAAAAPPPKALPPTTKANLADSLHESFQDVSIGLGLAGPLFNAKVDVVLAAEDEEDQLETWFKFATTVAGLGIGMLPPLIGAHRSGLSLVVSALSFRPPPAQGKQSKKAAIASLKVHVLQDVIGKVVSEMDALEDRKEEAVAAWWKKSGQFMATSDPKALDKAMQAFFFSSAVRTQSGRVGRSKVQAKAVGKMMRLFNLNTGTQRAMKEGSGVVFDYDAVIAKADKLMPGWRQAMNQRGRGQQLSRILRGPRYPVFVRRELNLISRVMIGKEFT